MRRSSPTRARRDRGAVIPVVALGLTMLMTMTAFAVDLGRMRTERRGLQADVDAIAMDAVQAIRGLTGQAAQDAAVAEANESARRNGLDVVLTGTEVQVGRWDVPTQTFQFTGDAVSASLVPNAVMVDLTTTVDMFFDFSVDERTVSRWSVAVSRAQTKGELGSVVAGIEPEDPTAGCAVGAEASLQMTMMNHFYSALFDIEVNVESTVVVDEEIDENESCEVFPKDEGLALDAASYNGLAHSRILFRDLAAEAGAASPEALADAEVSQSQLLRLAGQALQSGEDPTTARYMAGSQLLGIAEGIETSRAVSGEVESTVRLGDVFSSTSVGGDAALDTSLTALDMVFLAATMIDGQNFIGADGDLSVPLPVGPEGTTVSVPMKVHVIEPPQIDETWKFADEQGPQTSQVTVVLDVPIDASGLLVDLASLNILGLGSPGRSDLTGTIPVVIELGRAISRYPSIQCPDDDASPATVVMEVTSGAARVQIGATSDTNFSDGVTVTTPGRIAAGGSATVSVVDALGLTVEQTIDASVGADLPTFGQTFTSSIGTVLDTGMDLNAGGGVDADPPFEFLPPGPTDWQRYSGGFGGISGSTGSAMLGTSFSLNSDDPVGLLDLTDRRRVRRQLVRKSVDSVLQRLDNRVLEPLTNSLGVTIGGADARILDVRCEVPALANRP